jgi:DNA-binding XRE family transcriptional regulator
MRAQVKPAALDPRGAKTFPEFVAALERKYPRYRDALQRERHTAGLVTVIRCALRDIRREKKVNQTELAARIGTSQPRVSAIEKGHGDIGLATVLNYLAVLNVSPEDGLRRLAKELAQNDTRSP